MKYCIHCSTYKDKFSPDKRNSDGLQAKCNDCANLERRKKYKEDLQYREKCKQRQKKYIDYAKQRAKRHSENLSDTYIIAELKRHTSLNTNDIRKYPELIELKRLLLKQYRLLRNGNKKHTRFTK